jgi:2-methylcitrate dehydratase PrpD
LDEFSDAAIQDPAVLALAARVRYELDATIDYLKHFSGHVKVLLDDGSVLEENQPHPRGGFEDPLPPAEVEVKFRANAGLALPKNRVEKIIPLVRQLESLPAIGALTDLLQPG